jgi:hypothetical protein
LEVEDVFPVYQNIFHDLSFNYPDMPVTPIVLETQDTKISWNLQYERIDYNGSSEDSVTRVKFANDGVVLVGIIHKAREDKRLFIPSFNRNDATFPTAGEDVQWNHKIFTLNTTQMAGIPLDNSNRLNICFRWDLISNSNSN